MPVHKKIISVVLTATPNRWKSQRATNNYATGPLPKESRLKSAARLSTVRREGSSVVEGVT
jgi:hypothetical protein